MRNSIVYLVLSVVVFVTFQAGRYYQSSLHHDWVMQGAGLKCNYLECSIKDYDTYLVLLMSDNGGGNESK